MGATTFVGYLKDYGDDFRMIVSYSPSGAQGQVSTPYGIYLIQTLGDQQWLIDVERSGLHRVVPTGNDALGSRREAPDSSTAGDSVQTNSAGGATTADTAPAPASPSNADNTQIDLLVLYTSGVVEHYGGADQAKTHIQNLVALANQAYVDSGVNITLRLAGAVAVDAPDDSANMDTLVALTNGSDPYGNAAQLRADYVADLVTVVRPFTMKQGGLCGLGWVGGSGGVSIAQAGNRGFSVVSDGSEGNYYCSNYTLSHELGHNMGSMHDHATVTKQNEGHGAFPYSFAYGIPGRFGTIMSYIDPEVGKFSNPDKTCGDQTPCGMPDGDGVSAADNAHSLNDARRFVAAYMQVADGQNQSISIAGVITLQGNALSGVQMTASSSANCVDTGSNGSYSCIVPAGWSGNITPTLNGYTFDPPTLSINNLNSNTSNQNFTAIPSASVSAGSSPNTDGGGGGGGSIGIISLAVLTSLWGLGMQRRSRRHGFGGRR